jgi:superfamily II DNA helicase RecQ
VLEEIAREMPVTLQQFGTIKGVGQHKLQTLGEVFISVVREHRKKG